MSATLLDAGPSMTHKLRWSFPAFERPHFALHGFEMTERISSLFTLHARLSINRDQLDHVHPEEIIGKVATITAEFSSPRSHTFPDGSEMEIGQRMFTGIVTRFTETGEDDDRVYYSAEVSPWLWLLAQTADCRVFQNMSAIQIVTQIFDEFKQHFSGVVYRLRDAESFLKGPKRDYCVQYNETALNFVSRLLEEEGIYYYFEHRVHEHTLVLASHPAHVEGCLGQRIAKFPTSKPEAGDRLSSWSERHALVPGRYTLGSHHAQMTDVTLERSSPGRTRCAGNEHLEVFEYPGDFAKPFNEPRQRLDQVVPFGDLLARTRMEEEECGRRVIVGTSDCLGFTSGCKFERMTPEGLRDVTSYLLTEVHHTAVQSDQFRSGRHFSSEYSNRFECIPAGMPYRPQRITARPVIHGVQTARVIGPSEESQEEIHLDEFGRVRVRFPWSRRSRDEERTSAWVRVGQGWASSGFGMHFWPRVGDEVIVAFLNGDPDCPIIVGSVYNDRNMPPYPLPEEKTKSGIKTRSTKEGDSSDFNEIRFEDRKGQEQLYVHAQRTLSTVVEASESRSVGASRTTTIGRDDKLTVNKGDRTATIEVGNDELTIQEGNRKVEINEGDDALIVANGNADIDVPTGQYFVRANEIVLSAASSLTLRCGPSEIVLRPGTISINVPGSHVDLVPAMIDVKAPLVMINS